MRVVNENFETITEYDLTKGYLTSVIAVKEDAKPIDNIIKFAWANEDYEEVKMYLLNPVIDENAPPTTEERLTELETAFNLLLNGATEVKR